jgi:hypothetical protein
MVGVTSLSLAISQTVPGISFKMASYEDDMLLFLLISLSSVRWRQKYLEKPRISNWYYLNIICVLVSSVFLLITRGLSRVTFPFSC